MSESSARTIEAVLTPEVNNPHRSRGCCRNCGRRVSAHSLFELRICAQTLKALPERQWLEREVSR